MQPSSQMIPSSSHPLHPGPFCLSCCNSGETNTDVASFPEVPVQCALPEVPVQRALPEVPVQRALPEVPVQCASPEVPVQCALPRVLPSGP